MHLLKGDFVQVSRCVITRYAVKQNSVNRLGVIVRTDEDGGCFRGHVDIWFGDFRGTAPIIYQVLAEYCMLMPTPISE